MRDWLVERLTVFGVTTQNWRVVALAIIVIGIAVSRWLHRDII
jgi:hypothetical protein